MILLQFFTIIIALPLIIGYVKFTNVKCVSYDESFVEFHDCKLKALSPNKVAFSLHAHLLQLPVNNVSVNLDVYRKANGYRPFLFNKTVDFCQFLKNQKRIPMGKILMDIIVLYSNINHTCPFNHDIIFKDFILKNEHLLLLPVPTGDYLLRISVGAYNEFKAIVSVYVQRVEE